MSDSEQTVVVIRRVTDAPGPALVRVLSRDGSAVEAKVQPGEELTVRLDRMEELTVGD